VSHTAHPPIQERGLADDCPRCTEIADDPFTGLDDENLRELVRRTLDDRFGIYGGTYRQLGRYGRSNAEGRAMAVVMTRLEYTGKLFNVAAPAVARYLRDRWSIQIGIDEVTLAAGHPVHSEEE
jgi:hypothetical protein